MKFSLCTKGRESSACEKELSKSRDETWKLSLWICLRYFDFLFLSIAASFFRSVERAFYWHVATRQNLTCTVIIDVSYVWLRGEREKC